MILTNIKRLSAYKGISEHLDKAMDFILSAEKDISLGKHIIDGDEIYAIVSEITPKLGGEIIYEAHRKYIDLHYILEGTETARVADLDECISVTEYNAEDDYLLCKANGKKFTLSPGEIYIVHPADAHAPGGTETGEKIKKIVVKVKVD